jgi:hypothetical protein
VSEPTATLVDEIVGAIRARIEPAHTPSAPPRAIATRYGFSLPPTSPTEDR